MPSDRCEPVDEFRLGFACAWNDPPKPTWSYTPWNLRAALRDRVTVLDLGLNWSRQARLALKVLGAHRQGGRWRSNWKHLRVTQMLTERKLHAAERHQPVDVVLQIGDLAPTRTPFLLYQDLSFGLLLTRFDRELGAVPHFDGLDLADLNRLADRQRAVYAAAGGVLTMSAWLADHLVCVEGLDRDRVHVVPPAANVLPATPPTAPRPGPRRKLIFVGKDFHAKAGDQVVAALALLRRDVDPEITLTVVGPQDWPLPGPIPDGVTFLGRVSVDRVSALYREHDLFVMPSRFEGYGIVFVEALAHGLPCVARADCAMPEIVRNGHNGALVASDRPAELADAVARLLTDDAVYATVAAQAPEVAHRHTWGRVADDVLRAARTLA